MSLSDFTIYTTQAQSDIKKEIHTHERKKKRKKNELKIKEEFKNKLVFFSCFVF